MVVLRQPARLRFGGGQDISDMPNLGNLDIPDSLPVAVHGGRAGLVVAEFQAGLTGTKSIDFPILQNPST